MLVSISADSGLVAPVEVCPRLPSPSNGYLNASVFPEGHSVNVTCEDGYRLPGGNISMVTHCNSSLQWTVALEDCRRELPIISLCDTGALKH